MWITGMRVSLWVMRVAEACPAWAVSFDKIKVMCGGGGVVVVVLAIAALRRVSLCCDRC